VKYSHGRRKEMKMCTMYSRITKRPTMETRKFRDDEERNETSETYGNRYHSLTTNEIDDDTNWYQ
jgi:hypothetical protein